MLHLTPAGSASCPSCSSHAANCRMTARPPRTAFRSDSMHCLGVANSCGRSRACRQKRRFACNAKKSKKKRAAERFEERPVDEDFEAAAAEPVDSTEANLADTSDTTYEVLDEEPVHQQQQYQTQAAAPAPQAPANSGSSDLIKLGALGLGAAALIAAVVFAIRKFAQRSQSPEEEKVHLNSFTQY